MVHQDKYALNDQEEKLQTLIYITSYSPMYITMRYNITPSRQLLCPNCLLPI